MHIDKDVPMTARDGVVLRADVYRPDGPGRFPVLLSRLPYDKNGRRRPGDIDVFVEHGYVVIFQDTRGRFASDGDDYYPLPWHSLSYDTGLGGYLTSVTADQLKAAPKYKADDKWNWSDPDRTRAVDDYYRL